MSACTQRLSPCCRKNELADGDPPPSKKCCQSASCRSKCSPCCVRQPKLPRNNSTSVLSPNHYVVPKKKISPCCRRKAEEVEYLHYSGDKLDDVFATRKKGSCCSSGGGSPTKRSSCCSSGGRSPAKRSSCCSSGGRSPAKRSSCCSSGGRSPTKRSSCCSSGKQTPKTRCPSACCSSGVQASGFSDQTCCKPAFKHPSSIPSPPSHGGESPSCKTHRKNSVYFSPVPTQSMPASLKTPILGQSPSIQTRRRGAVCFSQAGASPKPESQSLLSSPKSQSSGGRPFKIGSSSRQLQPAKEFPSRVNGCPKSVSQIPSSSQTPKHFHLYRPVSWPAEIRTNSSWKEVSQTNLAHTGSQPPSTPPSTSAKPCSGFAQKAPTSSNTAQASAMNVAAPDPQQRKSILKLPQYAGAVDSTTVTVPSPDPQQRPTKRADASTKTAAPEIFTSQTTRICSPTLVINSSRSSTSSSSSSSRQNSPSRLSSSCFFFARSPKRSRPSTLEAGLPKSKSLRIFASSAEGLHQTTSTSSELVPRNCSQQNRNGSSLRSDPVLPPMPPQYGRLPSRPQIDSTTSPHYQLSAELSYDFPAQTRSRARPVAIPDPDVIDHIPSLHYQQSASSNYDSQAQTRSRASLPDIPHNLSVSSQGQQRETPSRPPASSWFRKSSCGVPGRARKFWARLWNKSTCISSAAECRLQDLANLFNPILSASKGPANPQYIEDQRWIECSDTRAFFIFGVNVLIVIFLTYFVDLVHDGKQSAEAARAADQRHNSKCCHHQHPPNQYRGYPVYNVDIMQ